MTDVRHATSHLLPLAFSLLLCSCAALDWPPAPAPAPPAATPPETDATLLATARAVIARANDARASAGAGSLQEDAALMRAAQEYAVEIARRQRLDHASPTPGRETMTQRIEAAGARWQRAAENLAFTSGSIVNVPRETIAMWLDSPGHRRNMLDAAYGTTGAGVARDARGFWYVVQIYVTPPARGR